MPSCCFLRGAKSQRSPGNKNPANILLSCINLLSFLNTPCFLFLQYTLCCNDSFVNKHDLALYFPSCVNTRLLLLKSNFIKILFCALQFFIKIKKSVLPYLPSKYRVERLCYSFCRLTLCCFAKRYNQIWVSLKPKQNCQRSKALRKLSFELKVGSLLDDNSSAVFRNRTVVYYATNV